MSYNASVWSRKTLYKQLIRTTIKCELNDKNGTIRQERYSILDVVTDGIVITKSKTQFLIGCL